MTSAALLEARALEVERGGVAVLDVPSFRLEEGELVSLIGPNGSGKSTLLLSLMGLLPRRSGEVLWRGAPLWSDGDVVAARRRMAMVLQDPLLFHATVHDNVASGLRIRGVPRAEERRRVTAYLERFGLAAMAGRSARTLSGGEARRVSIARALVVEPEVVFLDEPFAHVDPPTRAAIADDLERTIRETGTAAILVTHDQSEALRLSDRIVVMHRGTIVQSDVPAVVMNAPVNEFVASCMGMETILDGMVVWEDAGTIRAAVAGAEIVAVGRGVPGDRVYCCIRPEHVTIELTSPAGTSSARNVLAATIAAVSSEGAYLKVKLDCGGFPLVATVTTESFTTLGLERGRRVFASFKATAVHLIHAAPVGSRGPGAAPAPARA
jgi:tungstate transport system ATP-binding protein